jgi:hypothetical protein
MSVILVTGSYEATTMKFTFGKHGVASALEQSLVQENQE